MDERKAERVRESVRTGLAKALAATAEGLATVSRAAASTAAQLRPPEPARDWLRSRDGQQPPPREATAAREAAREEPATGAAKGGSAPSAPSQGTAAAEESPRQDEDEVAGLVERNARDVIAEVSRLDAAQLRRLRAAEQRGKARKTVLAAIDRALE